MAKIFVNYRRDDAPADARGIRDALAEKFGKRNIFMDIDNLLPGQRFDQELEKALAQCDVLIAVMGSRWLEILATRSQSGERDFVQDEIGTALQRGIPVIPVRVGREGSMPPLPSKRQLTPELYDLLLHQKMDIAHERFGRDCVELIEAIRNIRRAPRGPNPWGKAFSGTAVAILVGGLVAALSLAILFSSVWHAKPDFEDPVVKPTNETIAAPPPVNLGNKGADKPPGQIGKEQFPSPAPSHSANQEPPSVNGSPLDLRLQSIPVWVLIKKEYPDWYSTQITAANKLVADKKPDSDVATLLAEGIVSLRRQNADKALAASSDKLQAIATAFLDHLKSLRAQSVSACFGFISKGETSPAVVQEMEHPETATALNAAEGAIFEAASEGAKSPVTHDPAIKSDYDVLIRELAKLNWTEEDLQIFSSPKRLAKEREPEQVCRMVQEWIMAHLAVQDEAVRDRLIYETLKPVVSG